MRVVNRAQLVRDIKGLDQKVLKSALGRAVTAGSKVFQKEILQKVPSRTGNLRRHIMRETLRGKNAFGREVEGQTGLFLNKGDKSTPYYGVIIDAGFSIVTTGRYVPMLKKRLRADTAGPKTTPQAQRRVVRKVPGRHFISGSFVTGREQAISVTESKLAEALTKAWGSIGK